MLRKVDLFFKRNIWRGWVGRLSHMIFTLWILAIVIQPWFRDFNQTLLTIFLPQAASKDYPIIPDILTIFGYVWVYSFVGFNIGFLFRNWKWDLFYFLSTFYATNLLGLFFFLVRGEKFYFLEFNLFFLFDLLFTLFYRLSSFEREKNLIQLAFGKYVNKELLEELVAQPDKLNTLGEQKEMTVLFCDLRGFTSMSEKVPPHRLVELLNLYLEEMTKIILKYEGTIDKFIGDAIMAFWNAPIANKDHAKLATVCAMEMLQRLRELQTRPEFADFKLGIGINTGQMVVGNIGGGRKFDYTVLGDNVNLASRIEGLTKKYSTSLLISEDTFSNFGKSGRYKTIFRLVDRIRVKGKSQPVKIYEPLIDNGQNRNLIRSYHQAFRLYQKRQFKLALPIFDNLAKNRQDPISKLMTERILSLDPNTPNWDGIWNWDEK